MAEPNLSLESLELLSEHGALKGCDEDTGWRAARKPCCKPQWTRARICPASHTLGEPVRVALELGGASPGAPAALTALSGEGPLGIRFEPDPQPPPPGAASITLTSTAPLPPRIQKLSLDVRWSAAGAELSPALTSHLVYVTLGRPQEDRRGRWQEDGVTLKRMDTAVSWVAPLDTLDPHAIVSALLSRFPYYTLQPSPKVPRKYGHPGYFNDEGGAWAMAEHPEESGECQAIARFTRGVLRQLGVPGDLKILLVWADPRVNGGRTPIEVDWEESPTGGLDARARVNGRRCVAALVDGPVEEGKTYPASHTRLPGGRVSPGLNRYEAFMRFSHGGETLYYAPGAGVYREGQLRLRVFWGLVWVSSARDDGFRVEKIVTTYR